MSVAFPNDIMIEVTNVCNLKCTTCYSHQDWREKRFMSLDIFKKIVNDIPSPETKTISLYNYGEPLMHPDIWEMVRYAKTSKIKNVKIATNGTYLTARKSLELIRWWLDYLSISVDGTTQEVYEKFRIWGNIKEVLTHTKQIVELKKKLWAGPKIELQFIIMSHNQHQIPSVEALARNLGVDYLRYKTVLIKDQKWWSLLPKDVQYTRYNPKIEKKNTCHKPEQGIVINVDGEVIPCCYITDDFIPVHRFWNIETKWLQEVFQESKNQKFIETVATNKSTTPYCSWCDEWNIDLNYKLIQI